jgi:hypothetical protein
MNEFMTRSYAIKKLIMFKLSIKLGNRTQK